MDKERNEIQSHMNETVRQVLTKLSLINEVGHINTKHMFQLFGQFPTKGSYFLFGSSEWLSKSLIEITVQIFWEKNIPNDFAIYYSAYLQDYKNSSFKVAFSLLKNGVWESLNDKSYRLFEDNTDNTVSHISTFILNFENILIFSGFVENSDELEYTDKTKDCFIKMELVEPIYGFGAAEFPRIYSKAVLQQAKLNKQNSFWEHLKFWKKREIPLKIPSSPYVLLVDKIEISITYLNPLENGNLL